MKTAMLKTVRVRDIMATDVFTLSGEEGVGVALEQLRARRVGAAPVVLDGHIAGIVSRTDLADVRHDESGERLTLVKEVMTHLLYAVRADDPAFCAARLMAQENVHRVVVVEEDGTLTGIVSSMDIVRTVAEGHPLNFSEAETAIEFVRLPRLKG